MPRDYASLQRKPFLAPIWLSILSAFIAAVFFSVTVWAAWVWATADCTTIIVVRHAEKVMVGADPPLAPAGEARAQLLSRLFGDTRGPQRIDAIYASSAQRSRLTAAPLAARLGIIAIVASADPPTLARRVLREHAGGRVLIVGHGDTVPAIVRALSGAGNVPPISDDDYGTMYIVSVPRIGHANVLRVNY